MKKETLNKIKQFILNPVIPLLIFVCLGILTIEVTAIYTEYGNITEEPIITAIAGMGGVIAIILLAIFVYFGILIHNILDKLCEVKKEELQP